MLTVTPLMWGAAVPLSTRLLNTPSSRRFGWVLKWLWTLGSSVRPRPRPIFIFDIRSDEHQLVSWPQAHSYVSLCLTPGVLGVGHRSGLRTQVQPPLGEPDWA